MTALRSLPDRAGLRRGRFRRLFNAFHDDRRGATAVEFAIVAPVFFFLIFLIAETAMIFIAEQVLDNAVFESARLVRTGQAQKSRMGQADFRADLCSRMSVFIDCEEGNPDFYLDVKSYESFADMNLGTPLDDEEKFESEGAYDFGDEREIVVVRAYYQWPVNKIFGGLRIKKNLDNGKQMIGSFAAFRNEPFGPTT
ncbi:MAG: pilus assembly protein [Rhizobiales bacterium]|nr:pilus assembly protein [Hyphomicrobiales bacterium]